MAEATIKPDAIRDALAKHVASYKPAEIGRAHV